jgi:signal transduction histidine kinase
MLHWLQTSIVTRIGCIFVILSLIFSGFLLVNSYLTGRLVGVTAAIDQAGSELMRIYKLGVLLRLPSDAPSETDREAIRTERIRWERVLQELRYGTAEHGPIGATSPTIARQLQDLQERWDRRLRPTIDAAARSKGTELARAGQEYLQDAEDFVTAWSAMVRTLEREAAARLTTLYRLQIVFLIASLVFLGFALVFLDRGIRKPLQRLTIGAERLAADEFGAPIPVHSHDELGQLARAFERMAERIRQRIGELQALHATGQEIGTLGHGGLDQVLRRIADRAADLLGADLAVLMVRHPVLECWVVEAASGKAFDDTRKEILLFEETPFSNQAFETKRPVVVADLAEHKDIRVRFRDEFGAKSYVAVPLLSPHECIGVLVLLSTERIRRFTEWDVRLAQQFASYAAVTMENARLFDAAESELQLLQEKLKAVERNVAELTHEVKAPAGRVAEFASWIEKDYRDRLDDKGLRYLGWIKKEGADLLQLAERTLDLARITQAPSPLESVDTQTVVQEVLELLGKDCTARGITVEVSPDLPRLACRRIHLKQVLENLLSNAIKYMGNQSTPRIEIGWNHDAQGPLFFVRDNGQGIDPTVIDRVFLPFQRLSPSEAPGAGLGLSIVKTVVEQYGGSVSVDSQPGVGSTFYFRLPAINWKPSSKSERVKARTT